MELIKHLYQLGLKHQKAQIKMHKELPQFLHNLGYHKWGAYNNCLHVCRQKGQQRYSISNTDYALSQNQIRFGIIPNYHNLPRMPTAHQMVVVFSQQNCNFEMNNHHFQHLHLYTFEGNG